MPQDRIVLTAANAFQPNPGAPLSPWTITLTGIFPGVTPTAVTRDGVGRLRIEHPQISSNPPTFLAYSGGTPEWVDANAAPLLPFALPVPWP